MLMATLNVLAQKLQYAGGIEEMLAAWSDAERSPGAAGRQTSGAWCAPGTPSGSTWAVPAKQGLLPRTRDRVCEWDCVGTD
jgi:hypothetical protein